MLKQWPPKTILIMVLPKRKILNMKTGTNLGSVEKSIQEIQDTQSPVAVKEDCGWDMQKIHLPVKDSKILLK